MRVLPAITTLLISFSPICFLISCNPSFNEEREISSTCATSLSPRIASAVSPREITWERLPSEGQRKTPILGIALSKSPGTGYGASSALSRSRLLRRRATSAAALDPSTTASGMSLGDLKAPATKIPGLEVAVGANSWVLQKPLSFNAIPSRSANS